MQDTQTTELFRVAVFDGSTDEILETTEPTEFYTGAHMWSHDWNDDYPQKYALVERPLDGGDTWEEYDASGFIGSRPAWVVHLDKWQSHWGVK